MRLFLLGVSILRVALALPLAIGKLISLVFPLAALSLRLEFWAGFGVPEAAELGIAIRWHDESLPPDRCGVEVDAELPSYVLLALLAGLGLGDSDSSALRSKDASIAKAAAAGLLVIPALLPRASSLHSFSERRNIRLPDSRSGVSVALVARS